MADDRKPPRPEIVRPVPERLFPLIPRRDDRPAEPPSGAELAKLVRDVQDVLGQLKASLPPAPASVPPTAAPSVPPSGEPPARPSLPVRATIAVGKGTKWLTIGVGVLGILAQVAAWFRPEIVAPLKTLAQLLALLGGRP